MPKPTSWEQFTCEGILEDTAQAVYLFSTPCATGKQDQADYALSIALIESTYDLKTAAEQYIP